jgi:regulatory protein YycH of two-component signal transduction system YycFG
MIIDPKKRKHLNIASAILAVLIIVSMILLYLPALYS